jgi:eukaryotic-like serine/threonine-protein kinase
MGSIWVAYHLTLQVETAIKLIRPDLRAETAAERFINEARVAAHVEHPGIVSIFDLGVTERGDPFIVMELLKGEDLRELLRRNRRLSAPRAVQLLLPVADALAAAHVRGIVHRDLKPENVFLVTLEQRILPKIVDFGIAKPSWPSERRLTREGIVMGSPEYMSPEQALGREDIDQRVDVWSFCVVLYECLTGRPPFCGNYESTLNEIIEKPIVPITELGIDEPALWRILEIGLAKQRERRFQDMRSLGRALAEWLLERGVDDDVCAQSLRATWLRDAMGPRYAASRPSVAPPSRARSDSSAATLHLPLPDAAAPALVSTPAAWGVTAPSPGRKENRRDSAHQASTRVVLLALTLFGMGCAGGSVWLGSTLALPPPPAISGTVITPAKSLYAKIAIQRDRSGRANGTATAPAPASGDACSRPARTPVTLQAHAPRRATPPAELVFGF